ncbi:52 kDa repressor of the inhibitor of the protein kinase [Cyphomyrmex costatus]|uniref:52 kDa repressor of the inhibitor of the protein kinase n=2 Tax=Cyphomyrmex costatus TaxID=456900 RepID=A0A151IFA1_9HYME|nr:52 kDa repressor of the inhibitor of the protein kinase [Cyphomyrmex costatus]
MSGKKKSTCAVPLCVQSFNVEQRHFFRFPKEHDRWIQWIRACGRLDLEPKGPEYAYHNCCLCHLHFEKKWYNINKIRARLHPDAVPTLFGINIEQK